MDSFFDVVFCMGVLSHQRCPLDALMKIRSLVKARGTLIIETLIIDGVDHISLCPDTTYAKMRNVFFIPTVAVLTYWIKKAGFEEVDVLDVSLTTEVEQRRTPWMTNESLKDFLDPGNPSKTVEGYPAPKRVLLKARRKDV